MKHGCIIISVLMLMLMAGCSPVQEEIRVTCPGREDISQVVPILEQRAASLKTVRASGKCTITWYDRNNRKRQEKPDLNLIFHPDDVIYMKGNTVLGEMFHLGTNSEEFWLRMKPNEISKYWSGLRRDLRNCSEAMWINPDNLIEGLGVLKIDDKWFLSHDDGYDVLTRLQQSGKLLKQVYIDCCGYHVKKIEYHDSSGRMAARMELNDYEQIEEGFLLPGSIKITLFSKSGSNPSIEMSLKNINIMNPTESQIARMSKKIDPGGVKDIYRLNSLCEFETVTSGKD